MKFLTWNIRGLSKKEKRGRIKKTLKESKVDMVLLQETKQRSVTGDFIRSLWWNDQFKGEDSILGQISMVYRLHHQ